MSDKFSVAFKITPGQQDGHPHDLLARLYREIGISAVAAALEVVNIPETAPAPAAEARTIPAVLLGDDLAA